MPDVEIPPVYKKYFVDKQDERRELFAKLADMFKIKRGIYPGSFVHIAPSFHIEEMTYIDSDKRVASFFKDENVMSYIRANRSYVAMPVVQAFQADYSSTLPIEDHSFDIMFSFYAGFISQSCKKYLKPGGVLVCNNSHGDASLACLDSSYTLMGVIKRNGEHFSIRTDSLGEYFVKKDGSPIDREKVERTMTGENFVKKAYAYIFERSASTVPPAQ